MKNTIVKLFIISFVAWFVGCASRNPITPEIGTTENGSKSDSDDTLVLLDQTDCQFMGIKVITLLPGKLKARFEDERGIYFYADNFTNTFNAYSNAGILIPKNDFEKPIGFAEIESPDSLALLSCDNLNFTKNKDEDRTTATSPQK